MMSIDRATSPLIILLTLAALLSGQELEIRPVVFGIGHSAGRAWQAEKQSVALAGWGATARGQYGHWNLWAELVLMRYFGLIPPAPNPFTPEQGLSSIQYATYDSLERDINLTTMKVTYTAGGLEVFAGRFSQSWGPGLTSLLISEKPPPYSQFGFEWQATGKLRLSCLHGKLFSGILDSVRSFPASEDVTPQARVYLDRYVVGHRLDWSVTGNLTLGISEVVIYGGRGLDLNYFMPFVFYYALQNYLDDTDNAELAIDIAWHPIPGLRLYGGFLIDDWDIYQAFDEINNNKLGWQGGLEYRSLLVAEDQLIVEYNWRDHRVYMHWYIVNDAYSRDYPLGFWGGPHAQSLAVAYGMERWGTKFMARYSDAKRGEVNQDMLEAYTRYQYDRFTGPTERQQILGITLERSLFRGIRLELGMDWVRWTNPGFDPFDPSDDSSNEKLPEVKKLSFTMGLYYNFRLPGYSHPFQLLP